MGVPGWKGNNPKIYLIEVQVLSGIFLSGDSPFSDSLLAKNRAVMALIFPLTADISKIYKFCPYKLYGGKDKVNGVFPFYITGLGIYHRTEKLNPGVENYVM